MIQGTLLRMTIHMVSADDYWPFVEAIRRARRAWWLGATRRAAVEREVIEAAERTRTLLAGGPRPRRELVQALGVDGSTWNGIGLWVDLVRVPPSGTWDRRAADLYGLAEDWLGPPAATKEQGIELLIRRYLAGFGLASIKDLASWSGLSPASLGPPLGRMSLRRFRDPDGGELIDLPRAPLPDASTLAAVRYLPTWDATLLVHARRTQILPERFRPRVFSTKTPHSAPTFLSTGRSQGPGGWSAARSASPRSSASHAKHGASSARRPNACWRSRECSERGARRSRNSGERGERVRDRGLGLHRRPGARDPALLVHEERRADEPDGGRATPNLLAPGAPCLGGRVVRVREQWETEPVLLVERELFVGQVGRDPDHLRADAGEVLPVIPKVARLGGASGGVRLGVEVDEELPAAVVLETYGGTVLV